MKKGDKTQEGRTLRVRPSRKLSCLSVQLCRRTRRDPSSSNERRRKVARSWVRLSFMTPPYIERAGAVKIVWSKAGDAAVQVVLVSGLGLARKTHDKSGAQRQLGAFLTPLLDPRQRLVLRGRTFHCFKDFRARVLKGNIEIGQDLALDHEANDFIDMRVGVDILQPHPGAEFAELLCQIEKLRADLAVLPRARGIFQIDAIG